MTKLAITAFILLGFISNLHAQSSKISFIDTLSWANIKAKAVGEHKYILIDCYTTWCAPCKFMSNKIFVIPEVVDYVNSNFISVKYQMDTTKTDSFIIKNRYEDAKLIGHTYEVNAYPTYLIFAPNGTPLQKIIGSSQSGKEFIEKLKTSFDPPKQYYTTTKRYQEHLNDTTFLLNALKASMLAGDDESTLKIKEIYFDKIKDVFTEYNLILLEAGINSTNSFGFNIFLKNIQKIDKVLGKSAAEGLLINILYDKEFGYLYQKNALTPNWEQITRKLKIRFPDISDRLLGIGKYKYFEYKKNIPAIEKSISDYMKVYAGQIDEYEKNEIAWNVFLYSNNKNLLGNALVWSKATLPVAAHGQAPYMDTYANLLYKIGRKNDAIIHERIALNLARQQNNLDNLKDFNTNLSKMINNQKTWN